MSEGPRRLPLISLTTAASKPPSMQPSRVVAPTLAVADAADGSGALAMAEALVSACQRAGKTPFVVLSAFGAQPSLRFSGDPGLRIARLAVSEPDDLAAFVADHADVPGPWICVGAPTLRALAGALRVLVAAPEAKTHERAAAAGDEPVDLLLSAPRLSLADALIAAWLGHASS